MSTRQLRAKSVLPGFGLSLGFTVFYLSLIVLVPLAALVFRSSELGIAGFLETIRHPRVLASFKVTFLSAFIAALANVMFGVTVAWFLVRGRFPLKRAVDALVDLPFALPTAVSGIALTTLFAPNSTLGLALAKVGIKVAFTSAGITVAMIFIGLPFVIRSVQPALADLSKELEEGALSLGASKFQTLWRVVLPLLTPSILSGFTLAFSRALGEYGSVVFIAGNMPMKTEIASLLIVTKLEQFDYAGATAIAVALLLLSLLSIWTVNLLQARATRYLGN
ncbi:MAG TPA: sulfate ABC transporter permease subunit CysT [Kiritimatiellia bacterium]|nr:sulfate ABC transporter permease subunit CysT [Kiritimatiellia bacterium]HRU71352.1 sulfate ABC transporter permease subunit CysT [Kiritimatiellia bacterium]